MLHQLQYPLDERFHLPENVQEQGVDSFPIASSKTKQHAVLKMCFTYRFENEQKRVS
jgi:hypothetical protein